MSCPQTTFHWPLDIVAGDCVLPLDYTSISEPISSGETRHFLDILIGQVFQSRRFFNFKHPAALVSITIDSFWAARVTGAAGINTTNREPVADCDERVTYRAMTCDAREENGPGDKQ